MCVIFIVPARIRFFSLSTSFRYVSKYQLRAVDIVPVGRHIQPLPGHHPFVLFSVVMKKPRLQNSRIGWKFNFRLPDNFTVDERPVFIPDFPANNSFCLCAIQSDRQVFLPYYGVCVASHMRKDFV
jgi:hypothetical protein